MKKPPSRIRPFVPLLVDVVAPVAVYYILHRAGVPDVWALIAGGIASGITAVVAAVRKRKLESMSVLVLLMFLLTIGLMFVTQDARFLLVKPSLFIAGAGVYIFATTFRRPFLLDATKPFATDGEPERMGRWDSIWNTSPSFRRIMRVDNVMASLILVLEAVARAIIALSVPIGTGTLLSNLPGIVAILLLMLMGRFGLRPAIRRALRQEGTQAS